MFQLTVRCRLGLYVLVELARTPSSKQSVVALGEKLGVSENHLSKVMQTLAKARWIVGARGPHGGYQLNLDPSEVSMFDVVALFEGSPDIERCSLKDGDSCSREGNCQVKCVVREIEDHVYEMMREKTLEDLT